MEHSTTANDFIVVFDGIDKTPIKNFHADELESMKLAIGIGATTPPSFTKIAEHIYLTDPTGRSVCSFSLSLGSGVRLTLSPNLSAEDAHNITSRFLAIQAAAMLDSIKRLYLRMTEHDKGSA